MRHGRAKQARRTLQFYERLANVRAPYNLIVDGTFVIAVLKYKLPLLERLDKLLQHAVIHLLVCHSTIDELKILQEKAKDGSIFVEAVTWCQQHCESIPTVGDKKFKSDKSSSLSTAAADIFHTVVTANSHANESVPLIRLARGSVLLLEQPSKAIAGTALRQECRKWTQTTTEPEKKLVEVVIQEKRRHEKEESGVSKRKSQQQQRKKVKARGPNPLSCKKRKTSEVALQSDEGKTRRRRND